jgi:DNA-binding transcriptional MocR family regulator
MDGWSVDEMAAALRQSAPTLAYLIPDFQNPTGHRMDAETRALVAGQLRRYRTPVVVDETLIELDYSGRNADQPPPFACFADDYVLTVGSTSKSHWGGLRIGWLRAPSALIERVLVARSVLDLGTPIFEQLLLVELLGFPRSVLDERRVEYRQRRDILFDALNNSCPQWNFRKPEGGLSLWCEMDSPISTRLSVVAENFGLRIVPGARFSVHGGLEKMLKIPFVLPENELRDAVHRLAAAAASVAAQSDVDPTVGRGLIS